MLKHINIALLALTAVLCCGLTTVTIRHALAGPQTYEGEGSCPNQIGSANCPSGFRTVWVSTTYQTCNEEHISFFDFLTMSQVDYNRCCSYDSKTIVCVSTSGSGITTGHTVEYYRSTTDGRSSCQNSQCSLEA